MKNNIVSRIKIPKELLIAGSLGLIQTGGTGSANIFKK